MSKKVLPYEDFVEYMEVIKHYYNMRENLYALSDGAIDIDSAYSDHTSIGSVVLDLLENMFSDKRQSIKFFVERMIRGDATVNDIGALYDTLVNRRSNKKQDAN